MLNLTLQKRQLCDIQGRLFELALKNKYDSTKDPESISSRDLFAHYATFFTVYPS